MSGKAERFVLLCTCPLSQLQLTGQAIHSVLPAQLKKGTKVYAVNEIPTLYSFIRRAIPFGYLLVLPLYSLVLTCTWSVFHTICSFLEGLPHKTILYQRWSRNKLFNLCCEGWMSMVCVSDINHVQFTFSSHSVHIQFTFSSHSVHIQFTWDSHTTMQRWYWTCCCVQLLLIFSPFFLLSFFPTVWELSLLFCHYMCEFRWLIWSALWPMCGKLWTDNNCVFRRCPNSFIISW